MGKSVFSSSNALTYTEVHAAVLGVVVGVLAGYARVVGYETVAVGSGVVFVAVALGLGARGELPAAQTTLRREPWYALAAFLLGGALVTLL